MSENRQQTKNVCMLLINNFTNDSRVHKEALSLISAGYNVTVIAKLDKTVPTSECRSAINIIRVPLFETPRLQPKSGPKVTLKSDEKRISLSTDTQSTRLFTSLVTKIWNYPGMWGTEALNFISDASRYIPEPIINFIPLSIKANVTKAGRSIEANVTKAGRSIEANVTKAGRSIKANVTKAGRSIKKLQPITVAKKIPCLTRPITILSFNLQLTKAARFSKFDIVHAHDLNTLIAGYFIARRCDAKLVYDSHELYLDRNRAELYSWFGRFVRGFVEGWLVRKSNLVITVNESIAQTLADRYRIETPLIIMNIPSAKASSGQVTETSLRISLDISEQHKLLLYSGAITFNRGLESLVKSLLFLPDCHLVMMGFGADDYKNQLVEISTIAGVNDRVSFFGPVPGPLVTSYAKSADLGVAPIENVCLSYYLCSPNKLFEYLLAGLPIITSDFPELKRLVEKYDIGGTFDPSSPQEIADAVKAVFSDSGMQGRVKVARKEILRDFSWEIEEKKLIAAYEGLG